MPAAARSRSGGPCLLFGGQLAGENRDEHHVVDAEHPLEERQGDQGAPHVGIADPVHPTTIKPAGLSNIGLSNHHDLAAASDRRTLAFRGLRAAAPQPPPKTWRR
jgi:hypothetical protein